MGFEDWSIDALADGAWVAVAGMVVLGVAVLAALFAWLKGYRLIPVVTWVASALGIVLLFVAQIQDAIPELADWLYENAATVLAVVGSLVAASGLADIVYAVRLAKPASWWAQRRYDSDKYDHAVDRHGWSRIRAR